VVFITLFGEECNQWCLLRWWIHTVKLSPESNCYHMHVKVYRTLHAYEIWEMCHTWLSDLLIMCIGEIWWITWMMWLANYVITWKYVETCIWWCLLIGDVCTFGDFIWWIDGDKMWIIYIFDLVISLIMIIFLFIFLGWWLYLFEVIMWEHYMNMCIWRCKRWWYIIWRGEMEHCTMY